MAESLTNIRIKLRKDSLDNWSSVNPVLEDGEIAVVVREDGNTGLKVGDGQATFNQLPFMNHIETKTLNVIASALRAGLHVSSSANSVATGIYTDALANFSTAHGIEAEAKEGDDYSFVFNGENLDTIDDRYTSHGRGTFNINAEGGLNGVYIGEHTLRQLFDSETKAVMRTWSVAEEI